VEHGEPQKETASAQESFAVAGKQTVVSRNTGERSMYPGKKVVHAPTQGQGDDFFAVSA
jgi:hypothetical protein